MTERKLQEEIWKFVTGRLSAKQADRLFTEILKAPQWMDYLECLKGLYELEVTRKAGKRDEGI